MRSITGTMAVPISRRFLRLKTSKVYPLFTRIIMAFLMLDILDTLLEQHNLHCMWYGLLILGAAISLLITFQVKSV
jgi:hypothetical protein